MEYGWLLGIITFLVGLLFAVGYDCLIRLGEKEQCERECSPEHRGYVDSIKEKVSECHIEGVLKDYEIMNRENERRGNITLVVGTILVTASFLILGNAATNKIAPNLKYLMSVVSIVLYILWLFGLHYTSKKLDDITFCRIRAIEQALGVRFGYDFGIHRYVRGETEKTCWIEIRRRFWVWVLMLLFLGWALIFIF